MTTADRLDHAQARIARLEAELALCRRAVLDAVFPGVDAGWHEQHDAVMQRALDAESAHNNVDDGDLYGRDRRMGAALASAKARG